MLVDSHCHLDYFTDAEIGDILFRAAEAGVGEMVSIGVRMAQAPVVKALAERFPQVWGTVGVHPQNVGEGPLPEVAEIVAAADHPRIIGIGESGLDYFYDKAPREVQQEGFRRHIRACQQTQLPLVIHARDADEDIAAILREERASGGDFPFLLHCFSSGRQLAEIAVEMGGYVSFSGILTFPKSTELRDIARDVPADRLLVETDSPYLAPVPFRGKPNEPSYVAHTARVLSEVREMTPEALAELTTRNFRTLFKKAA
ncbi:YchF/TatD family DNA exonuclease [Pseudoroseomonas wenyumeiae]|uniref:TatD family deoxyribonuclease n=1 Tax=Teichococcus wenyumeiae TaxID=2478470 RepID=A0A3A9JU43_9PROT|nr:TatD family hydrolase [Pseudoroseomonas wenyumeiae]RKK04268.1 TatD family deoxyribonuclease [Pseudoroseomonas wenyumeiae]RMI19195.1 YchF/TatD family DNA exonuclease [Pseudoroseomonas wenyumeiae]